jgi:hypothetical protein
MTVGEIKDVRTALLFLEAYPPQRGACKRRCGIDPIAGMSCVCEHSFPGHENLIDRETLEFLQLAHKTMLNLETPAELIPCIVI